MYTGPFRINDWNVKLYWRKYCGKTIDWNTILYLMCYILCDDIATIGLFGTNYDQHWKLPLFRYNSRSHNLQLESRVQIQKRHNLCRIVTAEDLEKTKKGMR